MPVVKTLVPPGRSRERIMGFGHEGSGKSSGLLSIARLIPTATFYVLDNDESYDRLLETDFADVAEVGNVKVAPWDFCEDADIHTWEGSKKVIQEVMRVMTRDDWLVVDMVSKLWQQVQTWFIEQVFEQDVNDYFLKVRIEKEMLKQRVRSGDAEKGEKEAKSLGALEGWMDWPIINSEYNTEVANWLLKCPGNLFCVAEAQKLQQPDKSGQGGDDKGTRELYGTLGSRPAGQKRSGHIMQTVLFHSSNRSGQFKLETVKDRGRPRWRSEVFEDFGRDYLVGTAGWQQKMVRVEG